MPIVMYKRTTAATALNTATNWDAATPGGTGASGVIPNAGYTAQWDTVSGSTSGGGTQTGTITPDGIVINASSAAMTLSGAITVGADGITMGPNYGFNSDALTLSGGVTVNGTQTWTLNNVSNINTGGFDAIRISGLFQGSGTLNLVRQAGGSNQYASIGSTNTTATFSGTVKVNDNVWIGWPTANGNTWGTTSTIEFVGTGAGSNVYWASGITINAGLTIKVNGNVTWGVPAAAARTLTIAGPIQFDSTATRTFTIDAASSGTNVITISGPLSGTQGFAKGGPGSIILTNTTVSNNISGPLTMGAGTINCGSYTIAGTQLDNITSISFPNPVNTSVATQIVYYGSGAYTLSALTAVTGGGGRILVSGNRTGSGLTFPAGALAGMTGKSVASIDFFAANGLGLYADTNVGARTPTVTINDLPDMLGFGSYPASNVTTITQSIYYTGPAVNKDTLLYIGTSGATNYPAQVTHNLYANGSGALKMSGGVTRDGAAPTSGTATLTLRGTSLFDNELSGPIVQNNARVLNIAKADAGKWILSGANTYTGATSQSGGVLSAQNNSALGSSTSGTYTQTGGTLDISGGVNLNKGALGFTLVLAAPATANLSSASGTNTLICGAITLNSALVSDIATGASLKLVNSGAMSGAFGVTTGGLGETGLGATANTFTGVVTVGGGSTLSFGASVPVSTNSPLGNAATAIALFGTLKYDGTGVATVARSLTFSGSDCGLDSSGTNPVTYSTATYTAGIRTITFKGSNTGNNTFTPAITESGGATSLTKSGASKWVLGGAITVTGVVTCQGGTWDFGGVARTFSGGLSVSGGTVANSTATIAANTTMNGGTITAELTGANTFATSGATTSTLNPTNGANSFSGAASVGAGSTLNLVTSVSPAVAGAGKVLGDAATTISGTVKTGAAGNQRGQMRYGGNLTFAAGAVLHIGGA